MFRIIFILGLVVAFAAAIEAQDEDRRTIEIVLQKSSYKPDHIEIKKGEKVRFVLTSMDVTHGFAIDEFDIAKEVSPGPPTTVDLTADRAGTFNYYCVVRCGKGHLQMRGTLVVRE